MPTPTTSSKNTSSKSAPSDAYATSQTLSFIQGLYTNLQKAKSNLTQKKVRYENLKHQQNNLGEEFTQLRTFTSNAKKNLDEAKKALVQVQVIKDFFYTRKQTTSQLVSSAQSMLLNIYEATEFVGQEGAERVENILSLAKGYNAKDTDPSTRWTEIFIQSVQTSQAKGQAALEASIKASQEAMLALSSNQAIDYRTQQYYNEFSSFEAQLSQIVGRLEKEYSILNRQMNKISIEKRALEAQLLVLNSELQVLEFEVAQYQAEYNAAQQGADYSFNEANSPLS